LAFSGVWICELQPERKVAAWQLRGVSGSHILMQEEKFKEKNHERRGFYDSPETRTFSG
jgi:hypothetical protein